MISGKRLSTFSEDVIGDLPGRKGTRRCKGRLADAPGEGMRFALHIALETLIPIIFARRNGIFHALHAAVDFVVDAF